MSRWINRGVSGAGVHGGIWLVDQTVANAALRDALPLPSITDPVVGNDGLLRTIYAAWSDVESTHEVVNHG